MDRFNQICSFGVRVERRAIVYDLSTSTTFTVAPELPEVAERERLLAEVNRFARTEQTQLRIRAASWLADLS